MQKGERISEGGSEIGEIFERHGHWWARLDIDEALREPPLTARAGAILGPFQTREAAIEGLYKPNVWEGAMRDREQIYDERGIELGEIFKDHGQWWATIDLAEGVGGQALTSPADAILGPFRTREDGVESLKQHRQ